jgi:hypothetical protein
MATLCLLYVLALYLLCYLIQDFNLKLWLLIELSIRVPNLLPTVVPSSSSTLLYTHSTSTTLFLVLSKMTI